MAIGSIAANWEFQHPQLPFLWGDQGPCLIQCHLGSHECLCQMASHSNSFSRVSKCDRRHTYITYRRTDNIKVTSVTLDRIAFSNATQLVTLSSSVCLHPMTFNLSTPKFNQFIFVPRFTSDKVEKICQCTSKILQK